MTERFFALAARDQGAISAAQGHQCRLGIQEPGAALDRHAPTRRNPTRSRCRAWRSSGRPATSCRASRRSMLAFERANWALGMKVLSCFALKLGFAPDFFTECHDPLSPRIPEHAAAAALSADGRRQARGFHRLARRRAYRFRLPDAAASAHRPRRSSALPRQRIRRTRLDRRRAPARRRHLQYRRHADALERRQAAVDAAPRAHAARRTNISARAIRCRSSARPTRTR